MNAAVALLVAMCISVVTATVLAFPFGGLGPALAAVSLGAGAIAGALQYWTHRHRITRIPGEKIGPWEWFVIVVYSLFSLRAFCWIGFRTDNHIEFLSPNNLGDLALHLTYIANMANGVPFWPDNPIFAGGKVHYPFGIDLFNSLLTLAGMDVFRGLVWVGLLSCLVTGIVFYRWGRGFALAGFLFNGGIVGFQFFHGFNFEDYQTVVAWKSIALSIFVTQRGMLYAIPAGLVLLWNWRERFFAEKKEDFRPPLSFPVEVLLYATMPLFHLHTFIFLSLLLGCWLVWLLARRSRGIRSPDLPAIVKLIAWSFIPATILVALLTGFFKSSSMIHPTSDWMWMYDEQPQFDLWAENLDLSPLWTNLLGRSACWFVNFGFFPFFILVLVYKLIRNRRDSAYGKASVFVFPSILLFILSLFVMLAPWEWDNTKIMIWPYFVILPFLWDGLLKGWSYMARGACCFLLFFSGFVSLVGGIDGSHTGYELASSSEVDLVGSAVRSLPVTAVFAAMPTYNHPLLLNGRDLVAGYVGHLWSHGIDSTEQLTKLNILLQGEAGWEKIARDFHVRYVFWGKREQEGHPNSAQPWKKCGTIVAEGSWGEIYDIENCY